MHDIQSPWHGCRKCSEGCQNCYMYYLDRLRDRDGGEIYRAKAGFRYPLSRDRAGNYRVKSGERLRVCMTSDFFREQAFLSGLGYRGKPIRFLLTDAMGYPIPEERFYEPRYLKRSSGAECA